MDIIKLVLECYNCGYKGKGFKELNPTKETLSFRGRCPTCKKISNFMGLTDLRHK